MTTGIPGHNRGKKFISGVGYRLIKKHRAKPIPCDNCPDRAAVYWIRADVRETLALCEACFVLADTEGGDGKVHGDPK